jgi:hypothetical protein
MRVIRAIEILAWSLLVRVLLKTIALERSLLILNVLPRRRASSRPVDPPPEPQFALAGACLGKSLARSQFLRTRGQPHVVVVGVRGGTGSFAAHAWLEGYDSEATDYVAIRKIIR